MSLADQQECRHCAAAHGQVQPQGQGHNQAQAQGQDWGEGQAQNRDPGAMPARSAIQASSGSQASRRLALHSSASSHTPTPLQMHSSASATLKDTSANECDSSVQKAHPDATGASRGNSTGESVSRLDSHQQRRAVACNLLCNLRVTSQSKDDLEIDSSIDAIAGSSEEQRETGASNMQMPVMKAERRQVGVRGVCLTIDVKLGRSTSI